MTPATSQPGTTPTLRTVALLPARLGSTRLPRKMLLAETGAPLFVHAARNVARCSAIARVVVATDSEEILEAGEAAGIEVLLTSPEHPSGTDRVNEAYGRLGESYDVVLNVQADEPDVAPQDLERLAAAFADPAVEIATLCVPVANDAEASDKSAVKVVRDRNGDALYFSRAAIPDCRHARPGALDQGAAPETVGAHALARHVGVYAFRPQALQEFCALPVGRLEGLESLEQLRWLESGRRIRVLTAGHAPRGIDTREDYEEFVARCAAGCT